MNFVCLLTFIVSVSLSADDAAPDWAAQLVAKLPKSEKAIHLFNGKDLSGWKGWQKFWSASDGMIRGANEDAVPSSTYLFTEKSFRNFRLLVEARQTRSKKHSTMHSAICALGEVKKDRGNNEFGFKGPLLMCCNDWGIWDAYRRNRIVPKGHRGVMRVETEKVGGWNQIEILVIGNRIRFVNNGALVFDFTDKPEMLKASPIGLQLHANGRPQEFFFRGLIATQEPEDALITLTK